MADPRPALRDRLRELRDADAAAFEEAKARYETAVGGADGDAALQSWIDYGRYLGDLAGEGRLMSVDATGFASPYEPPPSTGALLLHLPEDVGVPALPVMMPDAPTAAQQATLDLLVGRKLAL
jgi:hypothetical protein